MKNYVIKLEVRVGEYVKLIHHIVQAEDEDTAAAMAIVGESHSKLEWEGPFTAFDMSGELCYTLYSTVEVSDADYAVLKKYIHPSTISNTEVLKDCGWHINL